MSEGEITNTISPLSKAWGQEKPKLLSQVTLTSPTALSLQRCTRFRADTDCVLPHAM